MSAITRELLDGDGNTVYPVTKANAVYMDNNSQTVQETIDDMEEGNTSLKFSTNQIVKTLASGNVVTISLGKNQIIETTTSPKGEVLKVRTTTINSDGSMNIVITES